MSDEEKLLCVVEYFVGLIDQIELDKRLEWKHDVEPRWPDKKELARVIEKTEQILVPEVPEFNLIIPLRKFLNKVNIPRDEIATVLKILKEKEIIVTIDLGPLEAPGMIGFDTKIHVDLNKEKLLNYRGGLPVRKPQNKAEGYFYESRPTDWCLDETNGLKILHRGNVVFSFKKKKSNKVYYLKLLWERYGEFVSYGDVYVAQPDHRFPDAKVKKWKCNKQVMREIRRLQGELKCLPFVFDNEDGSRLLIKK